MSQAPERCSDPAAVHAAADDAHVAAEHGQVGQGLDVVGSVVCWVIPMQ